MGNNHREVHSRWLLSSLQSPIFSITLATMGVRFLRAGSSFTLFYCQIVYSLNRVIHNDQSVFLL